MLLVSGFCFLVSGFCYAWGEKGHAIVSQAAAMSLPNDMPHFFYRSISELVWLGYDPDRTKNAGESCDAVNLPDHQIDLELTDGVEFPRSRYEFIALLHTRGIYRRHGMRADDPGFLPWRIAELSELLQKEWSLWRTTSDPVDRRAIEHEIIRVAGLLGHYAGDAANPHHTTINYNGWIEPNREHFATDCDTHARFESYFVSHAIDVGDVVPRVAAPIARPDYFAAGVALIRESNGLVTTLYRIDRDKGFSQYGSVSEAGKSFATNRLATGAALLRDLWWSAWRNSAIPRRRGGAPATPPAKD